MRYVYLAGPMTGLPYQKALSWRTAFVDGWHRRIHDHPRDRYDSALRDVEFLDPLRGLVATYGNEATIYDKGEFPATAEYGRQRDMMDIRRSDIVVVSGLTEVQRVSIGTMMECGMAMAWGKPLLLVGRGLYHSIHDHPWLQTTTFRAHDTEQGVELLRYLLMGGRPDEGPEKEPSYANYDRGPSGWNIVPLARSVETEPNTLSPGRVAAELVGGGDVREAYPALTPVAHRTES